MSSYKVFDKLLVLLVLQIYEGMLLGDQLFKLFQAFISKWLVMDMEEVTPPLAESY